MKDFVLKGNICFSKTKEEICTVKQGYVVCLDGYCAGVYEILPGRFQKLPCRDYGDFLILPGFTDLHVHAPQYPFRGMGMDMELIDWLNIHIFPEESKYQDIDYAQKAYDIFVKDLVKSPTTRACIFGTLHKDATLLLMELLEEAGMVSYVGKVNMDRNCPDYLREESVSKGIKETREWIEASKDRFQMVKPILTPRFIPTCSESLMEELSVVQKEYHLPVQSHLSESPGEIRWVQQLCPDIEYYAQGYEKYGMFGGDCKTIMAHCVYSSLEEMELIKDKKVFVAHCPESNINLSSGVAPVRKYLEMGIQVGLGSDVAAGSDLSLFRAMAMAVQASKMRWRLMDKSNAPLKMEEVFYMATMGGGGFFGKVGTFEKDYEFDAVVVDDSSWKHPQELSLKQRVERMIYLAGNEEIVGKYIAGKEIVCKAHSSKNAYGKI